LPDTADHFIAVLQELSSDSEREKYKRYFKHGPDDPGVADDFIGVPMGKVFGLAKQSLAMSLAELEALLESDVHEARAGALSIMDKQARVKKSPEGDRKALHDLYLRRIDRVNSWDLVDLAAIHVVGGYLYTFEKPRKRLYTLARSKNIWERRTAIVATAYFLQQREVDDTFGIAELLVNDKEDLINKAVGGWIRQAGKTDEARLLAFLDQHAATMPRVELRYAIEKLSDDLKVHYRGLAQPSS
jgi:3-methyladenine DNA glycosylase AlkD